jgi:hypothetical protein
MSRYVTTLRRFAGLAVRRPPLIPALVSAAWRFRARGWYRRPPFLPIPSAKYLRWRMETAYREPDRLPEPAELERYLRWSAWMRRR